MNSTYRERIEKRVDYLLYGTARMIDSDLQKVRDEAIEDLTALIQEVAKSAKPERNSRPHRKFDCGYLAEVGAFADGYDFGIDQYEQNIIKELGGSE